MISHAKKLLIATLALITTVLQAEYIVYKEGRNAQNKIIMKPLTAQEHAQAFSVLMKYQFPMSLCHDLNKELCAAERELLDKNEEAFIASKLPKGIKIAFIPTVVYELSIIKAYTQTKLKMENDPSPSAEARLVSMYDTSQNNIRNSILKLGSVNEI